jgi:hypothetical protein
LCGTTRTDCLHTCYTCVILGFPSLSSVAWLNIFYLRKCWSMNCIYIFCNIPSRKFFSWKRHRRKPFWDFIA